MNADCVSDVKLLVSYQSDVELLFRVYLKNVHCSSVGTVVHRFRRDYHPRRVKVGGFHHGGAGL